MEIQTLGMVGFGQMGTGITQVSAQAGYKVIAYDLETGFMDKGIARITKNLDKAIEKGKISIYHK